MKYITLVCSLIFLASCSLFSGVDTSEEKEVIVPNKTLYKQTTDSPLSSDLIEQYENQLYELDIKNADVVRISLDDIMTKGLLLDYLGHTGESIAFLESHFVGRADVQESSAINYMLAEYYEKLGAYKQAIERYEYLIEEYSLYKYLQNISDLYKKLGNIRKADLAIRAYEKIQEELNGVLE